MTGEAMDVATSDDGLCGAKTRAGTPCRNVAGKGTDHVGYGRCKHHGGSTKGGRTQGERLAAADAAAKAVKVYGLMRDEDPHDVLAEEVMRTAAAVRWLGTVVAELQQTNLTHGVTRTVSKSDGTREVTAEAKPNAWVVLYQRERDHLVRVCRAAVDAGISERRVQIEQEHARVFEQVMRGALADLGIPVTEEVTAAVANRLRGLTVIDGGAA